VYDFQPAEPAHQEPDIEQRLSDVSGTRHCASVIGISARPAMKQQFETVRQLWESLGNTGHQHASIALKTVPLLDGLFRQAVPSDTTTIDSKPLGNYGILWATLDVDCPSGLPMNNFSSLGNNGIFGKHCDSPPLPGTRFPQNPLRNINSKTLGNYGNLWATLDIDCCNALPMIDFSSLGNYGIYGQHWTSTRFHGLENRATA
jgi:hypothetical protein